MEENIQKLLNNNIFRSCIVILVSIFLYEMLNKFIFKKGKSKNSKLSNRNKTYLRVFSSFTRYTFIIVTFIMVLQIN